MKRNKSILYVAILFVAVLVGLNLNATIVFAKSNAKTSGCACQKGKYIYYAYEMGGLRMNLMRYDTKTGKTKSLRSFRDKGDDTNGFYNLNVTDKYIIATWDKYCGTADSNNNIYRFNRSNGKNAKKLATGRNPVVIGKYIYYVEGKKSYDGGTQDTGYICRMKFDGSNKKRVCKAKGSVLHIWNLNGKMGYVTYEDYYANNNTIAYFYDAKGNKISETKYYLDMDGYKSTSSGYYVSIDNKVVKYNKTFTSKKQLLSCDKEAQVVNFKVCGNHMLARVYDGRAMKGRIYMVNLKTKKKKLLKTWMLGE